MFNAEGRRKFHRDNRGAALAMTLIIIAFIAILAAVLMFVAYAGFRMRSVDRQGKDTFYTAETVLDEINVGLQGLVSEALTAAYEDVMINYSMEGSANNRNVKFRKKYFEELQTKLQTDADHYNITTLRGYLSKVSLGDGTNADGSRAKFGSYGAIVESDIGADDTDPISYKLEVNNNRLLLKDLRVSYVNEYGYVSIISTDIRIDLPAFNFSQAAAVPPLETCSLLADDTLLIGNEAPGGSVTIKGDAYAGQMYIGTPDGQLDPSDVSVVQVPSALDPNNLISLPRLQSTGVNFVKADSGEAAEMSVIVSRNGVEVGKNSTLETKGAEFWAQNLILNSAEAELDGSINLKDDLTLSGQNSTASLKGEYNGFGYYVSGSDAEGGGADSGDADSDGEEGDGNVNAYRVPDASSSIVINGRDSSLDLSGLQRMTISGRAYVATAYNAKAYPDSTDDEKKNKTNIMMGESVAVKSNQLIYLVPGEALGCRIEKGGITGNSEYGCNPLTLEQYTDIIDHPDKYVLLDADKEISTLGYKKLSNYIVQEQVAGGGSAYVPEIIFRQTNAGPLVYCYLRFPSEDAANSYFRDYYDVNAEYVDRYMKLYASEIKMADRDDLLYLNIAGNMLAYEGEAASSLVSSEDSDGNRAQAQRLSAVKDDIYKSLSVKLVRTSSQLTGAEMGRTAFPNIIDELEVENVLDAMGPTAEVYIDTKDASDTVTARTVLTKKDEYIVDNSLEKKDVKVIVSLGNVTVKRNFSGLIIAKGNITVEADAPITLEPIDVNTFSDILHTEIDVLSDTNDYYLMYIFTDGLSYAYSGNVAYDEGSARVSMVDLISYERWTKK